MKRTKFCSVETICLLIYLSNLWINKKPLSTYCSNMYFLKTVFNINLYNLSNKTNWGKKTQFYAFLYMYVMKGLRKKGGTIKGSGLRDHYWIGYSLSVEKLFNCHQGSLHVIEPFQLPLLWHNEPKIITVGQKKPPQCLTQSIKWQNVSKA